jgi:hypothetical protein
MINGGFETSLVEPHLDHVVQRDLPNSIAVFLPGARYLVIAVSYEWYELNSSFIFRKLGRNPVGNYRRERDLVLSRCIYPMGVYYHMVEN